MRSALSSIVAGNCVAGVVKIGAFPVPGATVLSNGVGASSGVVALDGPDATYIASNATDIAALISSLGDVIDKIITIVTGLDGISTSPGAETANIALLLALKITLLAQKDTLK